MDIGDTLSSSSLQTSTVANDEFNDKTLCEDEDKKSQFNGENADLNSSDNIDTNNVNTNSALLRSEEMTDNNKEELLTNINDKSMMMMKMKMMKMNKSQSFSDTNKHEIHDDNLSTNCKQQSLLEQTLVPQNQGKHIDIDLSQLDDDDDDDNDDDDENDDDNDDDDENDDDNDDDENDDDNDDDENDDDENDDDENDDNDDDDDENNDEYLRESVVNEPIQTTLTATSHQYKRKAGLIQRVSSKNISLFKYFNANKTSKHNETSIRECNNDECVSATSLELQSGFFGMQGRRKYMEDQHDLTQHPQFNTDHHLTDEVSRNFFAVYDGHGGKNCAEYCANHLKQFIAQHELLHTQPLQALIDSVVKTDREFCNQAKNRGLSCTSGSTLIAAFLIGRQLHVANVGDSRAVLGKSDGKAMDLSEDHKPSRLDEKQRILDLGGFVARRFTDANPQTFFTRLSMWCHSLMQLSCMTEEAGVMRVYPGGLAVSRSIGDFEMKASGLVISTPEVTTNTLTMEDDFLILACDGVWDVLTSQEAVSFIRQYRSNRGEHPGKAARALANKAYTSGSTDNISVLIVFFSHIISSSQSDIESTNRRHNECLTHTPLLASSAPPDVVLENLDYRDKTISSPT